MRRVVNEDYRPRNGATLNGAIAFLRAALFVFGEKVEGVAGERTLQLVTSKVTCEFVTLLSQLQCEDKWSAIEVGSSYPASSHRALCQQQPWT